MKVTDFVRLKKLMMLAANNTNDGESIRAFRVATEIVRAHGYTWEQVMDRRVTVLSAVEVADEGSTAINAPPKRSATSTADEGGKRKPPPRGDDLDESDFELAMNGANGTFLETLQSIYEQWENNGTLSPRQIEVVRDAAERAAGRHPGGRFR